VLFSLKKQLTINESYVMKLFFLHPPLKKLTNETILQSPVLIHEPLDYTSEGSEFLDDAIRMKDQPLINTEEEIDGRRTIISKPFSDY